MQRQVPRHLPGPRHRAAVRNLCQPFKTVSPLLPPVPYPAGSSPSFCDLAAGSVLQDDWPAVWAAAGGTWPVPRLEGMEAWLGDTSPGARLLEALAVRWEALLTKSTAIASSMCDPILPTHTHNTRCATDKRDSRKRLLVTAGTVARTRTMGLLRVVFQISQRRLVTASACAAWACAAAPTRGTASRRWQVGVRMAGGGG